MAAENNPAFKRKQLLTQLIKQRLEDNTETDSVIFDIKDLTRNTVLKDFDDLERTLVKMKEELKPDFHYQIIHRNAISSVADINGSRPSSVVTAIKISLEDSSVLDDYPSTPTISGLHFDTAKSRFLVRGTEIKIQKFSDQYHTLRIMFEDPKEIGKEWFFSEIAERVDPHKKDDKTYYNATYQIKTKLKSEGFPTFFITTRQSAQINPKYLS